MSILKIEIERNGTVDNVKTMAFNNESEFFTALVTLCDEMGADVPLWTTHEERILKKEGHFDIEMGNGGILRISSYTE